MENPNPTISQDNASPDAARQASEGTRMVRWTTVGGMLAAFGVCASCCLLPLALVALGAGDAWVSGFDLLVRYKPIFVAVAAGLLGYAFYAIYWKARKECRAGAACKTCQPGRSMKVGLWVATILAVSSVVFDYLEPYLLGS